MKFKLFTTLVLSFITIVSFGQIDKNGKIWDIKKLDQQVDSIELYSSEQMLELVASRYKSEVDLYILARRPFLFSKIVVLRRKISDNKFSQVKQLEPKDFNANQTNQIIKITDKYPEPGQIDVYYKLVGFTKEGAEYIFPSVFLRGYGAKENDTTVIIERFVPIHDIN